MADIFLSHSSADNDTADQIKTRLKHDRESWSVFLDKHPHDGILAGQSWQDRLRGELQSCRLVLAIITTDWLASRWCFTEAVTATFRGKDFIGVLPGILPDEALDVAPPIVHERQRLLINLATGEGWKELLNALDRSGLDPSQWFSIPEGVGPYPGFVAFEEKDAGVFFGRDQEITDHLNALNLLMSPGRAQALVISGSSGSGKSSLLKAGLMPRLRRQPDWLIIPPFDLSREPIHALFSALRAAAQATGANIALPQKPPQTVEALAENLQDSLRSIEEKANAWLLLPLDQAEVLLASSQEKDETDASRLLAAVGQLLASRTRKLIAVFTIRTEFMPALERALPGEIRLNDRSLYSINALSAIIEKPAARFGIELEEGLTSRMVEDTRGADALPLLAYTLRQLYENYGHDKHITVAEYEQLGGVEGAIEKKLHQAFSDPKPSIEELVAFRRVLVRHLVRVDDSAVEGERYLRTAVALNALSDDASRLIERLREARLLVSATDGTISIAHERLIRDWTDLPLQTWLAQDRDDRKLIDILNSFLIAHRDGGPLLSEKPLIDAKDFLERDRTLKADEPELANFIEKSLLAERSRVQKQKWQFRGAIAASLVFLVVAIGAVMFFYRAKTALQAAETANAIATVRRLLAEARTIRYSRDEPALILEAYRRSKEHGLALSLVEEELRNRAGRDGIKFLSGCIATDESVAFSPDNRWLVTSCSDGFAKLWSLDNPPYQVPPPFGPSPSFDLLQREPILLRAHQKGVSVTEFTPDSSRLITGGEDGTVRVWDLKILSPQDIKPDIKPDIELEGHDKGVKFMATSPDSRRLITAAGDGIVRVWDLEAKEPSQPVVILRVRDEAVKVFATSSDGRWLATASEDQPCRLWDLSVDNPSPAIVDSPGHTCVNLAFSPDSRRLVTRGANGSLRSWDLTRADPSGSDLCSVGVTTTPWPLLAISPDGRWLAASEGMRIRVWDLMNGCQVQEEIFVSSYSVHNIWVMAFTPDGRRLVTATPRSVQVSDLPDRHPESATVDLGHSLKISSPRFLAISPDGHWLVGGDEEGDVSMWSLWVEKDIVRIVLRSSCKNLSENDWETLFPDEEYQKTCISLREEQ